MNKQYQNEIKEIKKRFRFGAEIVYSKILKRSINNAYLRVWKPKIIKERTGVVVGWKWLFNGKFSNEDNSNYLPSYFIPTGSIFVLEVKSGMLNSIEYVLPIDTDIIRYRDRNSLISKRTSFQPFTDENREVYRQYASEIPRDSKGRWTKNGRK